MSQVHILIKGMSVVVFIFILILAMAMKIDCDTMRRVDLLNHTMIHAAELSRNSSR